MLKAEQLAVYFVMGSINCKGMQTPLQVLEDALQAGITIFQLREKGKGALQGAELEQFARQCQSLCRQYSVPFIVNDDIDLALKLGADGVHVGQEDEALLEVKQKLPHAIIGVSVHTEQEMQQAVAGGANYVGIGPIYATSSKEDARPAAGVGFLQSMRQQYGNFPIVAIGGITGENAAIVKQAGADGVAVISELCQSNDRKRTVRLLCGAEG
ncbi:thiamine-phosphate synthase [Paenibacillus montaniterrae]|uniref:Thiamine-phosphate synthase n=1 Tax=Paenibacillus montaniterrae TaxID=429341 RepID=A0A920CZ37_9BACL|nr:thiamine-phosphate synthase [Paenibacillus montaniterrae]